MKVRMMSSHWFAQSQSKSQTHQRLILQACVSGPSSSTTFQRGTSTDDGRMWLNIQVGPLLAKATSTPWIAAKSLLEAQYGRANVIGVPVLAR